MSERKRTPEHVDWEIEGEFDYTDTLSLPEWGWEFLRRNPDYRKDWEQAKHCFANIEYVGEGVVIDVGNCACDLLRWGCLYSSDPIADARTSRILWQPNLCSHVLRLKSLPVSNNSHGDGFVCETAKCWSVLLVGGDREQHLLFCDAGRKLQVVVQGENVRQPVSLIWDSSVDSKSRNQIRWKRCFDDLQWAGRLIPSHFGLVPRAALLKRALIALDGSLAGASQRQIAAALFGASIVSEKWDAPGRPLRYKVRRAIRAGNKLMRGGYRNLIR